jgi:hypothetical protein
VFCLILLMYFSIHCIELSYASHVLEGRVYHIDYMFIHFSCMLRDEK